MAVTGDKGLGVTEDEVTAVRAKPKDIVVEIHKVFGVSSADLLLVCQPALCCLILGGIVHARLRQSERRPCEGRDGERGCAVLIDWEWMAGDWSVSVKGWVCVCVRGRSLSEKNKLARGDGLMMVGGVCCVCLDSSPNGGINRKRTQSGGCVPTSLRAGMERTEQETTRAMSMKEQWRQAGTEGVVSP